MPGDVSSNGGAERHHFEMTASFSFLFRLYGDANWAIDERCRCIMHSFLRGLLERAGCCTRELRTWYEVIIMPQPNDRWCTTPLLLLGLHRNHQRQLFSFGHALCLLITLLRYHKGNRIMSLYEVGNYASHYTRMQKHRSQYFRCKQLTALQ